MHLYHEKQVAALCGVHCINALLQGPYFSELDLAQIGHELDQLERQMLDNAAGTSGNLDESGMFSVQVLTKALQVWGLTAINVDSEELKQAEAAFDPQQESAFICNLQEHWFTIRQVDGEWWNFNSLYPAPEALSAFYLTAYLDSLKGQGYTIFVIRGPLPASPAATGTQDMDGPGTWWAPEEARAAHQTAQQTRQVGRARNAMEGALARAAAAGGTLTLRPSSKRSAASQLVESDEEADLAAAIAASMEQHTGGTAAGSSYAAVAAGPGSVQLAGGGSMAAAAAAGGLMVDGDDDPELAAALAASLEEHQQQQQPSHQQATAVEQEQAVVTIPEEPPEGAEGVLTVAFRLPSGFRLSRRFSSADSVGVVAAFVTEQLKARGELAASQRIVLSTQFPRKALDQLEQELSAAGIEDRSILNVTFC